MRYGFLSRPIRYFIEMAREHKAEWYIVVAGAIILTIIVLSSVFAPLIAPYGPLVEAGERFSPPSREFIMGTNNLGFDVFSRILYGSRTVLLISIAASIFSAFFGIPIGLLSGYYGGKLDRTLSLVMDSIYSFPGLILAIAMAAMLGPGVMNISLAIAVIYVPTYFRIVRGQVLSVKAGALRGGRPLHRGKPVTIMSEIRLSQRDRLGCRHIFAERRRRHPYRGGPLVPGSGSSPGSARTGGSTCQRERYSCPAVCGGSLRSPAL